MTHPGRVVRRVVPLVVVGALGGCDLVLGTQAFDPFDALCGPYGVPAQVQFDSALGQPTDFSVAADSMHGLVTATYNGITGPTPILFDGTTWVVDVPRNVGAIRLATALSGGHMGTTGDVYGWLDHDKSPDPPIVVQYVFTTSWSAVVPNVDRSTILDLTTGNEVESDAGNGAKTRYVVELRHDFAGSLPAKLEILAASPAAPDTFAPTGFTDPINGIAGIAPTGGVLTGDHEIFVYSAKLGAVESHLFETPFSKFEFAAGSPIALLGVAGKADDQPWINGDCSQIWFRRDGVTWTAQKM